MSTLLTGDQKDALRNKLFEIERQIRQKDGYPFDPADLNDLLQRATEGKFDDEILTISARDGSRTIAGARSTFQSGTSFYFTEWGLDKKGEQTEETPVRVHEIGEDVNSHQMFTRLSPNLESLCFTQDQIIEFCEKHRSWLRTGGYATFFLIKGIGRFFVVSVHMRSDGLVAYVDLMDSSRMWLARDCHRLVVPRRYKEYLHHLCR